MKNSSLNVPFLIILFSWIMLVPGFSQSPGSGEPDPDQPNPVQSEPIPVNMNEVRSLIGYPPAAREANIQGKVVLKVLVGEDGENIRHIVVKSPHSLLTRAVEEQIGKLRFSPAIKEGKPVQYWLLLPFEFKLIQNEKSAGKARGH